MKKIISLILTLTLILVPVVSNAATISIPTIKTKALVNSFQVSYPKVKNATGYQIAYKKSALSTYKKVNTKLTKRVVKDLSGGTKYKCKVRAYKTVNGKKKYGSWSKVKNVTTLKRTVTLWYGEDFWSGDELVLKSGEINVSMMDAMGDLVYVGYMDSVGEFFPIEERVDRIKITRMTNNGKWMVM